MRQNVSKMLQIHDFKINKKHFHCLCSCICFVYHYIIRPFKVPNLRIIVCRNLEKSIKAELPLGRIQCFQRFFYNMKFFYAIFAILVAVSCIASESTTAPSLPSTTPRRIGVPPSSGMFAIKNYCSLNKSCEFY